jgi:hypothetical protein
LQKKRRVEDGSCLFCNEPETVAHMFFESCVSSVLWNEISDVIGMKVGSDFESVARWWLCDKKLKKLNVSRTGLLPYGLSGNQQMVYVSRTGMEILFTRCVVLRQFELEALAPDLEARAIRPTNFSFRIFGP